jgi:molybdate transport repressor ModE-like protein
MSGPGPADSSERRSTYLEPALGIELRHLAALEVIASEGSLRAAADRLGYVQSSISAQLKRLEQLVGARLVERSRGQRTTTLTEEGELLLARARRVLARLEAAQEELADLAAGRTGTVRVGVLASVAANVSPRLIAAVGARRPGIDLVGSEAPSTAVLLARLGAGEIDLAVCERPEHGSRFGSTELVRDPVVALVAADSPLARATGPIALGELAGERLIGPEGDRERRCIAESMRAAGGEATFVAHAELHALVAEAVGAGVAVALLPRLGVPTVRPATRVVELRDPPVRTLVLAWSRERGRSAAARELSSVAGLVCAPGAGDLP